MNDKIYQATVEILKEEGLQLKLFPVNNNIDEYNYYVAIEDNLCWIFFYDDHIIINGQQRERQKLDYSDPQFIQYILDYINATVLLT